MKKPLLLTSVLLALTASLASAAPGLDMAWGGCPLGLANPSDVTDPCTDSGAPNKNFYLSFKAPAGITRWVGEEFAIDVQTDSPNFLPLPDWWHLEAANPAAGIPPGCRDGDYGFATTLNGASTTACKDYWGPAPQSGGTVWIAGFDRPSRTRMYGAFARTTSSASAITADIEYYVGSGFLTLNHADLDPSTTPCNGCPLHATLVLTYVKVNQPAGTPGGDVIITSPNLRNIVTWQRVPVPVRRRTWGQVKSLYR